MEAPFYNLDSLLQALKEGKRLKYIFFWSHQPKGDGLINATCLSQWYLAPFKVKRIEYPTAEHFLMAEKARLFGDEERLKKILETSEPGAAKRFGREVCDFDETVWEGERFRIAVEGNIEKFSQNKELGEYLVGTNERVLVEASPVDRIWGIGLSKDDERVQSPESWQGKNLLGFVLMKVRDALKARI